MSEMTTTSCHLVPLWDPLLRSHIWTVEVQQSTESFPANDGALSGCGLRVTVGQGVPQSLMVPLVMVVRHVLCNGSSKTTLPQEAPFGRDEGVRKTGLPARICG
jgi:hypothetical protein